MIINKIHQKIFDCFALLCYNIKYYNKILQMGGFALKLSQVKEILNADILTYSDLNIDINSACGSDLMSDVLSYVKDQGLLLTGLLNPQVVRTAEMMDIKAIVFVRGKEPEEFVIELARSKKMALLKTKYPLYIACGLLYSNGLIGN